MLARALLMKPRLILADEPVSMVDASLRATILASLQRMNTGRSHAGLGGDGDRTCHTPRSSTSRHAPRMSFGLTELRREPADTGAEGVWLSNGYIITCGKLSP